MLYEEREDRIAVEGGAELPDRRGDGGMTWAEILRSEADVPQEEAEP